MNSIVRNLRATYTTWSALSAFLTSEAGGALRIDDSSTTADPFALIRYVKGKSNMSIPHVAAFRSVVWDTLKNRPVSITPPKSAEGESTPESSAGSTDGYVIEHFIDGVMIGLFWDEYNNRWRVHTRSCLDAECRYFSQTRTFAQLFDEAADLPSSGLDYKTLIINKCYTYVLQHPENRIVVPVTNPKITLVSAYTFNGDNIEFDSRISAGIVFKGLTTWDATRASVVRLSLSFKHRFHGLVIKDADGNRWKLRGADYNRVRLLRGNSARRDYLWLSSWAAGSLSEYLALYPEERLAANAIVTNWKRATSDVFHIYTDVFKARSLARTAIPPKYRPLIYGLHTVYMDELKPIGKTVDWKATLNYMNGRDVAQMLFVLNWDARMAAKQIGAPVAIPVEASPSSSATTVVADDAPPVVGAA